MPLHFQLAFNLKLEKKSLNRGFVLFSCQKILSFLYTFFVLTTEPETMTIQSSLSRCLSGAETVKQSSSVHGAEIVNQYSSVHGAETVK